MLALMLACGIASSPLHQDTVSIIELNHVCDPKFEDVKFHQFIFYCLESRPNPETGKWEYDYHVIGWRMTDLDDYLLSGRRGKWTLLLWDDRGSKIILRSIKSVSFIETTTNFDREVSERCRLPMRNRTGLATTAR